MKKCIYCLKDKDPDEYKNREHVIPQCYGTFAPDNLVLHNTVCDECNQYFGDKIEIVLGRDSLEGVYRYRYGIKPKNLPKKHKRVKTRIEEGKYKGMIMIPRPAEEPGISEILPIVQVGFKKKQKLEYWYFEPEDIPSVEELEKLGYDLNGDIVLIAEKDEERDYLVRLLNEKGIDYKLGEEREWTKDIKDNKGVLGSNEVQIDSIIMRGLSKIAFNYLTHITSKEFVLSEEFNGIREFIRHGKGDDKNYFQPNEPYILRNDRILSKINKKETTGHLIVVVWEGSNLICKLSPFNLATYRVWLCKNFSGILRPIRSGHCFDVDSKTVSLLLGTASIILP